MNKAVVLLSGGLDSATCLAKTVDMIGPANVMALNMYYGQRHEKEIKCAQELAVYYGVRYEELAIDNVMRFSDSAMLADSTQEVPDGTYMEQQQEAGEVTTYVPFRNGLLLSIAASIACAQGYDTVVFGAHRDDTAGEAYPDCSALFISYMNSAVSQGTGNAVGLYAPYARKTKADIVAEGLRLKVPYEKTWSCYKGGDKPCGKCATCIDRDNAFKANGKEDPLWKNA